MLSRTLASTACALLLAGCPDFDKFNQPPSSTPSLWATARFGGDTFFSAWSAGGTDLLLVGGTGELVHSDDGATFSVVQSNTEFDLHGVWGTGATDAWFVGANGATGHYDGSPSAAFVEIDGQPSLNGVWGAAANDYVAVGDRGVIYRFDGMSWSTVESGTRADLLAVTGAGAQRWAASSAGEVLHSSDGGANWDRQTVATGPLRAMFAAADNDVWAVGDGDAWHSRDGATWTAEPVSGSLYGVWAGGSEVFAVGAEGAIFHRSDGAWSAEPAAVNATLRAVWATMPATAHAAGTTGTIVHRR